MSVLDFGPDNLTPDGSAFHHLDSHIPIMLRRVVRKHRAPSHDYYCGKRSGEDDSRGGFDTGHKVAILPHILPNTYSAREY